MFFWLRLDYRLQSIKDLSGLCRIDAARLGLSDKSLKISGL